jgi:hypothetical protein
VTVDLFGDAGRGLKAALGREVERLGAIHGADGVLEFGPVYAGAEAVTAP